MVRPALVLILFSFFVYGGCTRHEVEMKPIHITVDVNVRVQKAVDDFYGDIYGNDQGNEAEKKEK